ncbi:hypothetical protein LCGC14_0397760 [marine sediment metagenome]|uniref:beta-N-acetylhexosaminidase n=1 Tax=marine sediment metagenome TaxID=412755 RepID=A0A0F9SXT5_9ZZZZ|nr:hypothetical protein [Phycisphaerae bacterium]HDZ42627.1 hypothetical protein [Phycisphaerae bacterium]
MLDFIPQPKKVTEATGLYAVPQKMTVGVCGWQFRPAAAELLTLLGVRGEVTICGKGLGDDATIQLNAKLQPEGYRLTVSQTGLKLEAHDARAAAHGLRTLAQIVQQSPKGKLPCVKIDDWPDFVDRGVYYDVARGRVPTLDSFKKQIDMLAAAKINHLQYYIEHTFRFRRHPDIGKGAGPLTADNILELDAYALERHVELVPSLSSFGHLAPVLSLPKYRHLAECGADGNYWSLAPALEESYQFLKELYDEFLPCFSSKKFNMCCDEVWDLGNGQSAALAKKLGKGPLYLRHIKRCRALAAKHGKKVMMWGDIVRDYPELVPEIPKDITMLDWAYGRDVKFNRVKDFSATGLDTYVCPSVNGYGCLFPRLWESAVNIAGWAKAGKRYGAIGVLNTDWGDGGHFNFTECAYPGYLFGAEQSWNINADSKSFWRRFCKLILNIESKEFLDAFMELGDLAQPGFWCWMLLYIDPGDTMFAYHKTVVSWGRNGKIIEKKQSITAADGRRCGPRFRNISRVLAKYAAKPGTDPHKLLAYWIYSVDTMAVAADKLAMFGHRGKDTPAKRKALKADYRKLMRRFEKLWMARNRRSEIRITLDNLRSRMKAL